MILDGFQYSFDDLGSFQNVHQIWAFPQFCYVEMLQQIQEKYGIILKHILSHINMTEIQHFQTNDITGHQKCGTHL